MSTQMGAGTARQFATFFLEDRMYGIDVLQVQEVTQALPMTAVRLAPTYVKGLINLRGQITTAIGLRELFKMAAEPDHEHKTVVCRADGQLLSLLVDRVGDVIEIGEEAYEPCPETLEGQVSRFMEGVYKIEGRILTVVGIERILKELNSNT